MTRQPVFAIRLHLFLTEILAITNFNFAEMQFL